MLLKYWCISKISFQEFIEYRGNIFIEMVGMLVTTFLAIGLWYSLYSFSDQEVIGGYTLTGMMTYLLGAGLVNTAMHLNSQGDQQMWDINRGTLNNHLLKPLSPLAYWFACDMAKKFLMLMFITLITCIVGVLFWKFIIIPSLLQVLLFLVSLVFGIILHFILFHLFMLGAFWMGKSWGLSFIFCVLMGIATGVLIPLELFPDIWKEFLLLLPFKFFGYVPMQIFLGKMNTTELLLSFGEVVLWIIGVFVISRFVYRQGLKVYGAYGG